MTSEWNHEEKKINAEKILGENYSKLVGNTKKSFLYVCIIGFTRLFWNKEKRQ